MTVQVIADPAGRLRWASAALPGSSHDLTAARAHGIIGALSSHRDRAGHPGPAPRYDGATMRRSLSVLVGLLLALASQVAVFWAAVLIGQSSALNQFHNLGPGSLGDIILILALVLTLDALLAGVLTLVLRRHRGGRAVALSTLAVAALIAVIVIAGLALR